MKVVYLLVLILGVLLPGILVPQTVRADETTTVRFQSSTGVPVFRIEELLVENSGIHLTSDINIVEKKMKLLTVSPSAVQLPNGNILLNIGGESDFNKSISLNLTGKPVTVTIAGSKEATMVWSAVTISGLLAFTLSLHNVDDSANFNSTAGGVKLCLPFVFATATLAGAVGIVCNYPRVDVNQN